jgi:hypothetical protein
VAKTGVSGIWERSFDESAGEGICRAAKNHGSGRHPCIGNRTDIVHSDQIDRVAAPQAPLRPQAGIAAMAGRINTSNLLTVVSVGILVGTEVVGVALAAGWALSGIFGLGQHVSWALMLIFGALGAYGLFRFMQRAIQLEPIRN